MESDLYRKPEGVAMNITYLSQTLTRQADLIRLLVDDVPPEQAVWKPDVERWSILEAVNHLFDEEREDFRVRLDILLRASDEPWPPIHPMEWVTERNYNERELIASLGDFQDERRASLDWLTSLQSPDWDAGVQSPWDFFMRAGDMAASWIVHGQWHIEQLIRLGRDWTIEQAKPYDVRYAGTL
jgi:DinB superfamily